MRRLAFLISLWMAAALPAVGDMDAPFDVGPGVGDVIPHDVVGVDQFGNERHFDDLKGEKGLVLFFFRSVAWCPYCQRQMKEVRDYTQAFHKLGFGVAALSYQPVEELRMFADREDVQYIMLSDPQSRIIDAFGLRNPHYKPGHYAHGVPYPVSYVIDPSGVIRAKLLEETYKVRPKTADVLAAARTVAAAEGADVDEVGKEPHGSWR